MDLLPPAALEMIVLLAVTRKRSVFLVLLLLGALAVPLVNLPWLATYIPFANKLGLDRFLDSGNLPMTIAGNTLAIMLVVWSLVRALAGGDPRRRMARKLKAKGDLLGAAEVLMQAGHSREASELFRKARAWTQAAAAASEAGLDEEAAGLLRRAGGRHLLDAGRLYRQQGRTAIAQQCDHELAEWHIARGHFDESIEAWVRAGELSRAVRATSVALDERRLKPSQPAYRAALRAAEQTRDHSCMARLRELDGNWEEAARAWRSAGEHEQAARCFRRVGKIDDAADEEAAAGHHKESANLRISKIKGMLDRLHICRAQGAQGAKEAALLRSKIERETASLIPKLSELGMEAEVIDLLNVAGRTEEAVQLLVDEDRLTEAAELAHNSQHWALAAAILERLERWAEASDLHEMSGNLADAARCAERAGEDERALHFYRGMGKTTEAAECMARIGLLQDALVELHKAGEIGEACAVLRRHPGPVPDIPEIVLDMAEWLRANASPDQAIACLQRAVRGVALQPGRLQPAVALAKLLLEVGETEVAASQVDRVLAFDYSYDPARELKQEIDRIRSEPQAPARAAADGARVATATLARPEEQRYEILNELGRGGMGVVYKARDTRLERDVAIKVLRTTSKEEAARLEQEAKAAATLNHPGIVTVFDFEAGFDGYFIAMEYVPGETLDKVLKTDHLLIFEHLPRLLIRLADAVAYAHSKRVIHRDLKPGNAILTPEFEVKILDFGIAARLDSGQTTKPSIVGTPFYMAPEQIRGKAPTPATDIYAFGATAFHLATGRPPFKKGNVIEAHLKTKPPHPLTIIPELSPRLADVILRCLAKKPVDRFASAADLREALKEV